MSIALSSGSPTRSLPMRVRTLSRKRASIDSCTSSREPAQHTWPWLNQIASTRPFDGAIEVGVVEHDKRRLAAQLERQAFPGPGGRLADDAADLGRAGERDLVDARMIDERRARCRRRR